MIISLLDLSIEGPVLQKLVNQEAHIPSDLCKSLLETLQTDNLIYMNDPFVDIDSMQRVRLATRAIELGADQERVSRFLNWKEFERIGSIALETHRYVVETNVYFKHNGHRGELDIVGCRDPLVVCVDCKHWNRGLHPSKFRKAADHQAKRTLAFAESLPNPARHLKCSSWKEAKFVPVVLSLVPTSPKFYGGTPIVSILQFREFLTQLPLCVDSVLHFKIAQSHLMDSL